MSHALGIDIGTSSVKALLVDEADRVVASATAALVVHRPHPGWSEQDPQHWWQATEAVLDRLLADAPAALAAVTGIGLSGQMHGATLLDAADQVLRPAILWNDTRAAAEAAALDQAEPGFRTLAGNLVMPGFTAPKLAWVKTHEPDIFARTARVLLPKDYVRLCLTGDAVSDPSDAAGTLWLDVARRQWAPSLLAATGLGIEHMPRLVEGTQVSGRLRPALARRWGFATAPVVAGGGGDNACAACGVGVVAPGQALVSLGTSGVVFAASDRFAANVQGAVHSFCHALPDTWHQMAVVLAATDSLEFLARLLEQPAAELVGALGEAGPIPGDPPAEQFLPYLGGERTPHNDAAARGAFVGLSHGSDRRALTRAVLAGVAFALADGLEAMAAAGTRPQRLIAVGGGARSSLWLAILAAVFGRPIDLPADASLGAALGAARLGRAAATGSNRREAFAAPAIAHSFITDPASHEAWATAHRRWQRLYPALKDATAHA